MKRLKPHHLYPVLSAIFPVLSLFAHNIEEVAFDITVRPLLISFLGMVLIILFTRVLLGCWNKAALTTSLVLMLSPIVQITVQACKGSIAEMGDTDFSLFADQWRTGSKRIY